MSLAALPVSSRLAGLLEPISEQLPCGQSLRYEPDFDRLRELRREDDASLPTGVWKSEIKRAEWSEVEKLATQLLLERSKDLMVSVWLGEAWLHRHALEGLPEALALISGLCERYPEDLHPQAEEGDQSWRVTPLDWLARRYAEIVHTRLPLFGSTTSEFNSFSLNEWQLLQRQQVVNNDSKAAKVAAETARLQQQKLNELARATPVSYWLHGHDNVQLSLQRLEQLERWSDVYLGDLAPTYITLRNVLQSLSVLLKEFIAMHPPQPLPAEDTDASSTVSQTTDSSAASPTGTSSVAFSEPRSREEAYRQLLTIADYLARTEPHSPVPYLIKRGVEWGNKPLKELLSELISADPEARRLWTLLGVL